MNAKAHLLHGPICVITLLVNWPVVCRQRDHARWPS